MHLGQFAARFKNDEIDAPAYDPAVLLKVVRFASSRGITSSHTIARARVENVLFIALLASSSRIHHPGALLGDATLKTSPV